MARLKVKLKKKSLKANGKHVPGKYVPPFKSNMKYVELLLLQQTLDLLRGKLGVTTPAKELEVRAEQEKKFEEKKASPGDDQKVAALVEKNLALEKSAANIQKQLALERAAADGERLARETQQRTQSQSSKTSSQSKGVISRIKETFSRTPNKVTPLPTPAQTPLQTPVPPRRTPRRVYPSIAPVEMGTIDDDDDDNDTTGTVDTQTLLEEKLNAGNRKGAGQSLNKGLYSEQIDHLMKDYPNYLGCFASDELDQLLDIIVENEMTQFGAIVNLDKSTLPGSHWVALYGDLINEKEVNYYDSLAGERFPPFIRNFFLRLITLMEVPYMLKLKKNECRDQRINSNTCGLHAVEFLQGRLNGKPFRECSGYDILKQEAHVKKKFGYI